MRIYRETTETETRIHRVQALREAMLTAEMVWEAQRDQYRRALDSLSDAELRELVNGERESRRSAVRSARLLLALS